MTDWKKKDLFAKIIVGMFLFGVILLILSMCGNSKSSLNSGNEYRCWYCSKIIYNDDKPIHATHKYLDTYTCDYCGKTNKIK